MTRKKQKPKVEAMEFKFNKEGFPTIEKEAAERVSWWDFVVLVQSLGYTVVLRRNEVPSATEAK